MKILLILTISFGVLFGHQSSLHEPKPKHTVAPLVSAVDMAKWSKVAWCETHGQWNKSGLIHDGGLGIVPSTWLKYGGGNFSALPHLATPEQQVFIALRINKGYVTPDQDGRCLSW